MSTAIKLSNPVVSDYLGLSSEYLASINFNLDNFAPIQDCSQILQRDVPTNTLYTMSTKADSELTVFKDSNIYIFARKKEINGHEYMACYTETQPHINFDFVNAITKSTLLQLYVLKKYHIPCFFIANSYGMQTSFNVTSDFSVVKEINNSENCIYEAICISENRFLFSDAQISQEAIAAFSVSILKLITSRFFAKFGIFDTFAESLEVMNKKITDHFSSH